jgi:leucyl/phenylalanyl-tRNA--protein transferase
LLLAYANGIFPWYSEDQPILWFSPDPRCVLEPAKLHIGRSLRKSIKKQRFDVRMDTNFEAVIDGCKHTPRPGQEGTWITTGMRDAYVRLHELGFAHSVEVWDGETLVGGLYGVGVGGLFAGESMFSHASDASKTALVWLVRQLGRWDFGLIDAQVHTHTLEHMGAEEISREAYLERIGELMERDSLAGPWSFDEGFDPLG